MDNDLTVRTETGDVRGVRRNGCRQFLGVPYASPPVGDLRWSAPRPPVPWDGVRDAREPGSIPPQNPSAVTGAHSLDEDCLFLNVTAPDEPVGLRPVMVWIHGDGASGGGSFFDPCRLASLGGVVVVTINYRLGILGGLGVPGLPDSGTFGLLDQQAALGWVRRNILAFGGDPTNVTVFGESYGGLAVSAHLTSPGAAGLFDRAIVQSGFALADLPPGTFFPNIPAVPSMGFRPLDEVTDLGATVVDELGLAGQHPADTIDALRRVPVESLLPYTSWFLNLGYGGSALPEDPAAALRAGRFHRLPVLSGNTADEARLMVGVFREQADEPVTSGNYLTLLVAAFGDDAGAIAERYPASAYDSPALAWAAVCTDRVWAFRTQEQNQLLAAHVPTYAYEFADRNAPAYVALPPGFPAGAYHSAELPYLFTIAGQDAEFDAAQHELSDLIIRYWTAFARSGDPNQASLPAWPSYSAGEHVQSLAPGSGGVRPADYARDHQLDLWERLTV
ncbi:MAG: carboxylesterase family protein [Actinocatenispora sp.]